jgi:hypothetical protein
MARREGGALSSLLGKPGLQRCHAFGWTGAAAYTAVGTTACSPPSDPY